MDKKLTRKNIILYSIGEPGFYFISYLISYYLLYFMTDVLFIPVRASGIIYSALQWVEAISALICGIIIDKYSFKNGKYRPWLLIGSFACCIGSILVFSKLTNNPIIAAVLFIVFYIIAYIGYNFMWIGYRSILGLMSNDPKEVVNLSITGSQLGTVAGAIFSYLGVNLVTAFDSPSFGYTFSAILYGIILIISMCLVYKNAEKFDTPQLHFETEKIIISLRDILNTFSKPFIVFFLAQIFRNSATMILGSLVIYYFKYVANNSDLMSVYLISYTIIQFLAAFFVRRLIKKYTKLQLYFFFTFISLVFLVGAFLLGNSTVGFIICLILFLFTFYLGGMLYMPFVNDIIEYNEATNKCNDRGLSNSVASCIIYIAQMLGSIVATIGLDATGYVAGSASQAESVVIGIKYIVVVGPAIVVLLSIVIMFFYKLDENTMMKIRTER